MKDIQFIQLKLIKNRAVTEKNPVFLASCFFLTELLSLARDTKLNFKILVLKQNLVEVSSTSNVSTQVLC